MNPVENEIYVRGFPAGQTKWRVSSEGGDQVHWRKDGKEIFFIAPDLKLMAVPVQSESNGLDFGTPKPLFALATRGQFQNINVVNDGRFLYDVMPDGQRFLVLNPAGDPGAPPM